MKSLDKIKMLRSKYSSVDKKELFQNIDGKMLICRSANLGEFERMVFFDEELSQEKKAKDFGCTKEENEWDRRELGADLRYARVSRGSLTYKAIYSEDDKGYVGVCDQFPSLSVVYPTEEESLREIRELVEHCLEDMIKNSET